MVDEEVFVDKLKYVNQYTDDLEEMRGLSKEQYLDDMMRQRAVERTLIRDTRRERWISSRVALDPTRRGRRYRNCMPPFTFTTSPWTNSFSSTYSTVWATASGLQA